MKPHESRAGQLNIPRQCVGVLLESSVIANVVAGWWCKYGGRQPIVCVGLIDVRRTDARY
jgi:hypothetical protein